MKMLLNNDVEITPIQFEDIKFIIDKRDIADVLSIEQDSLTFTGESKESIEQYLGQQFGYFKGVPVTITLDNEFNMPYFLDPSDEPIITDDNITLKLKKRFENLEFWELADGSTFDLLKLQYGINYDYKIVQRLVYRTDIETQILTIVNTFFQIKGQIEQLISDAKRVVGDGINAVGLEPVKLVASITYLLLMTLMLLIKLFAIVILINFLLNKIKEIILPTPQSFRAPQIKSLIVKSANALGYTVVSSLLDDISDEYYLGIPTNRTNQNLLEEIISPMANLTTLEHPTISDMVSNSEFNYTTFGGFLRWFKKRYNARFQNVGTVLYIERRDVRVGVTGGVTTGVTLQEQGISQYRPNTNEAWSRFLVQYPTDPGDQYTTDIWKHSVAEYQTVNIDNATNDDINVIRGYQKRDMVFSLGFRKDKFTGVEKLADEFINSSVGEFVSQVFDVVADVIDPTGLIGIQNPLTILQSELNNRKGMLITSDHYFTRPKILCLDVNGRIKSNWIERIGAEANFKRFHEIDFIGNNDFMIHDNEISECNDDLFVNLLNNDFAQINGNENEVLIATYQPFTRKSEISYKRASDYASTVKLVKL